MPKRVGEKEDRDEDGDDEEREDECPRASMDLLHRSLLQVNLTISSIARAMIVDRGICYALLPRGEFRVFVSCVFVPSFFCFCEGEGKIGRQWLWLFVERERERTR